VFERFTASARTLVVAAQDEARRRGDRVIATPHLLLAALDSDAGDVLRAHGITREAVEQAFDDLIAHEGPTSAGDAEILAALGIDVSRIRDAVEAQFGPGALDRALRPEPPRGLLARLGLTGGRRPHDEAATLRAAASGKTKGHIPFDPAAKKTLELSLREALRLHENSIDARHVALGLIRAPENTASAILARLGVDVMAVRRSLGTPGRRSA
jgi:ATP-dependent Clp protease ATP-binding subunit ClpA